MFTTAALALAALATVAYWTLPIVVGPLTVYCVALTLKTASTSSAHALDPRGDPADRG